MHSTFIIAEAGVNHNGNMMIAKKLIDAAVDAGADAVKFQTFSAEELVCKNAKKANYQMTTTDNEESQFEMLKKLELTVQMHKELILYCAEKKILFLSTPFDLRSIELLHSLDIKIYKVPSGEITNLPYLKKVASVADKIFLSTGMSTLEEVKTAVNILNNQGVNDIVLLHCNTEYPTPYEDVNLRAMITLKRELGLDTGYSDHTRGIEVPIAAVAMGATVIEKHFTLNRNMEGPDHKASIEPEELSTMVRAIRNIEMALGDGKKIPSTSESKNKNVVRKSIVAGKKINKGELLTEENLALKRPGTGISPMYWDMIIGKRAVKDFEPDEMIKL